MEQQLGRLLAIAGRGEVKQFGLCAHIWPVGCNQNGFGWPTPKTCSDLHTDNEYSNAQLQERVKAHQHILTGENCEGIEKPLEAKSFQRTPPSRPLAIATEHFQTISTHGPRTSIWNIDTARYSAVRARRVVRE